MRKRLCENFDLITGEINRYAKGIHLLNTGANEVLINEFERHYNFLIPIAYRQWLQLYNGGEFFALPTGTCFFGILGERPRIQGIFYLEDNFVIEKRAGIPNHLFVIGELCDGEIIGFDLSRTRREDGWIVQYDVESGTIINEWNGVKEWLNSVLQEGNTIFDYEGNEK